MPPKRTLPGGSYMNDGISGVFIHTSRVDCVRFINAGVNNSFYIAVEPCSPYKSAVRETHRRRMVPI